MRVIDASALFAALVDGGPQGAWVRARFEGHRVFAPHLVGVEVVQVLRRMVRSGYLDPKQADDALRALVSKRIELVEFAPFASRVWELRDTVSAYDAWYVAVAEAADAPLVTLDAGLARAPGPRCAFEVGPG
ncbi:PIN domain-containing protein [soil metagenome]